MNKVSDVPRIFDRRILQLKRDRAAKSIKGHNFIHEKIALELTDRLAPISADLSKILVCGGHTPILCDNLSQRKGTDHVYWSDMSLNLLNNNADYISDKCSIVVADEEYLPFATHSLDAIVSNLMLHSVNDLRGSLVQARQALKPDRPFVAALFGGETLMEVKRLLMEMEVEQKGGVGMRFAPFIDIKTLGSMMQSLGFLEPIVDSDIFNIEYSSLDSALADIRGMGEGSILLQNNKAPFSRKLKHSIDERFACGSVDVKVEILYVIAWSAQ